MRILGFLPFAASLFVRSFRHKSLECGHRFLLEQLRFSRAGGWHPLTKAQRCGAFVNSCYESDQPLPSIEYFGC